MTSRSGNLDDHSYGTLGPAISCHCLTQRPCGPTGNPELRRQLQRVLKPVSPGTIKAQLNKAFDALQKEHRPYFRYTVNLPIFVGTEKEGFTPARLINVSAEGMAVLVRRSAQLEGAVSLRFDLPSIDPYRIAAEGEIAWTDAEGRMGIKLSHMPVEARGKYAEWLDVLHGQHEFRRLTEEAMPEASSDLRYI